MRATFFGIELGRRGLAAQQTALDVTGHNINNVNTDGYTRQRAEMSSTNPMKTGYGYVGTGVRVPAINRMRDDYLDMQLRTENKAMGYWNARKNALDKLEVVVNEPSDESGLRFVMDQFWGSWEDLSKNPESTAIRSTVLQRGEAVVESFHHLDRELTDLREDLNETIKTKVNEMNSFAEQIKELNFEIVKAEAEGHKANDLRDRRDLLVDQMSEIANIEVRENRQGAVTVSIGGRSIVQGNYVSKLAIEPDEDNMYHIVWESDGSEVSLRSGQLKGLLEARDEIVVDFMNKLDNMAAALAKEVNDLHKAGYDKNGESGLEFFTFDSGSEVKASSIILNPAIADKSEKVAAADKEKLTEEQKVRLEELKNKPIDELTEDEIKELEGLKEHIQGDGSNALKIAQLKYKNDFGSLNTSFDDYFRSEVARIGIVGQEAKEKVVGQKLLVAQISNQREMVMGVSLDEEMANMIRFQHAYNSSARYITTVDEMLDILINRVGLVGR